MAKYRKLGRTSAQRKALLRNQVTAVINNGKIVTTEAKAKEVQKIVDGLIALAVKEKDNFETVKVTTKVARKDKDGKTNNDHNARSRSTSRWASSRSAPAC
jgi:large subunit ribosomal protein L17